jgi:cardiolipin synthase
MIDANVLSMIILISHWLIVIGIAIRVIMRRAPVGVSMAWLAVIASTPLVGAGFYILFGEKRLGRKRAARAAVYRRKVEAWQKAAGLDHDAEDTGLADNAKPVRRQAENILGFPAFAGNKIELIDNFQVFFDSLVADIDAAQSRCCLCFYIWHEGGRAADVFEALVRAAQRGVDCRVLVDSIGSKAFLAGASARRLRSAGVHLTAALPTGIIRTFFVRRDLRNHRKIVIIDDEVAYIGSQNLVDPRYFKQDSCVGGWVDAVMRVTGPTVVALDVVFSFDWSVETGNNCEISDLRTDQLESNGGAMVQVVPSGQALSPQAIYQLLLTGIYAARKQLTITTPYFVPDESILTALLSAALRGVEVTLIVPAKNDSLLVRHASVAHFDDLMSAGVRIALFEAGLLHTKSLTIDDSICVFGSVNLDMRSLWLNFEISLFIYNQTIINQVRDLQETYLKQSHQLNPDVWRKRSAWQRFAENTCRLLGPLL